MWEDNISQKDYRRPKMAKPYKPYGPPTRGHVKDYRCFEKNDCDFLYYHETCEGCPEKESCAKINGHADLYSITLKKLNEAYKDYAPEDIVISSVCIMDDFTSLVINRPETDEEFAIRVKEYEEKLDIYNKWIEEHKKTPENKKRLQQQKLQTRLEKAKAEAKRLEDLLKKESNNE
jgi:hypothetical protein